MLLQLFSVREEADPCAEVSTYASGANTRIRSWKTPSTVAASSATRLFFILILRTAHASATSAEPRAATSLSRTIFASALFAERPALQAEWGKHAAARESAAKFGAGAATLGRFGNLEIGNSGRNIQLSAASRMPR